MLPAVPEQLIPALVIPASPEEEFVPAVPGEVIPGDYFFI